MDNRELHGFFGKLSTPNIVDACLRKTVSFRAAPPGIRAAVTTSRIAGRVLPAQHYGSADVFFEAMNTAEVGSILVIDKGGRMTEACVGDLIALEAEKAGLVGIIVWGCHRDTPEIVREVFPVFSYGVYPVGPVRLDNRRSDALETASFGEFGVSKDDVVFADCDGVIFIRREHAEEIILTATHICETERRQTELIRAGQSLRDQFKFEEYMARREQDPTYTLGHHLHTLDVAIGEQGR